MFATTTIMGRLGKDPEHRQTQGGTKVAQFSIATTEWDASKKEERTQWYDCIAFGDIGDRLKDRVRKGDRLLVNGTMRSRKYTPKDGDREVTVWELVVFRLTLIDYEKKDDGRDTRRDDDRRDRRDDDRRGRADDDRRDDRRSSDRRSGGFFDDDEDDRGGRRRSRDSDGESRRDGRRDMDDDIPF